MMKSTNYNNKVGPSQNILILHNSSLPLRNPTTPAETHKTTSTDHNLTSPFIFTPLTSTMSTEGQQRFILSVNDKQNNPISVLTNVSNIDMNILKLNIEAFKQPLPIQPPSSISNEFSDTNTSSLQLPLKTSPNKTNSNCKVYKTSQSIPSLNLNAVVSSCVNAEATKEKVFLGGCKVCGDVASGKYFGALVCVPCKTFFLRYAGEGFSFVCKGLQDCDISLSTRIQCKFCRFKKCIDAGMNRKVRPLQVEPKEGRQLCVVCSDIGNGVHFGAMTCEGCKKFFRRGLNEHKSYVCKHEKDCLINPQTRNACRYCRYHKCKKLGMSREAIQMGRPSKVLNQQLQRKLKRTEVMEIESCSAVLDLSTTPLKPVNDLNPKNKNNTNSIENEQLKNINTNNSNNNANNSVKNFENNTSKDSLSCFTKVFKHDDSTNQRPFKNATNPINSPTSPLVTNNHFEFKTPQNVSSDNFQKKENQSDSTVSSSTPTDHHMKSDHSSKQALTDSQSQTPFNHITHKLLKLSNDTPTIHAIPDSLERFNRFLSDGYRQQGKRDGDEEELKRGPEERKKSARQSCSSPSITSSEDNCSTEGQTNPVVASTTQFLMHILEQKIMQSLQVSEKYWLAPFPLDENLLFSDARHWDIINNIFPNYDRFVQMSEKINRSLNTEYEKWRFEKEKDEEMSIDLLSEWIKNKVIPAFTVVSVTYCKKVPGFSTFDTSDQVKIIKFGQSPSRMLAAVLHWFEPATKNFKHFLSWRDHVPGTNDRFKQSLIKFAIRMQDLQLDPIEAALLNSLIVVSTDYENLSNKKVIESLRCQIISTFRAYTTAKYGAPNDRLEKLFQNIPELRKLGLLHNEMTNTRTMMAEEFGDRLLLLLNL